MRTDQCAAKSIAPQAIAASLRADYLGQPAVVTAAYAATVRAPAATLSVLAPRSS